MEQQNNSSKVTLICDFNVGPFGHNLGYIQNFYTFLQSNSSNQHFHFLLNPKAKEVFKVSPPNNNLTLDFVEDSTFQSFENENPKIKFENQWNFIVEFGNNLGIERLILMMFDPYQECIGKSITPFKISTIYFLAHYRFTKPNAGFIEKSKLWFRRKRKEWIIKRALRNKNLDRIYILNDKKAVKDANNSIKNVFYYLSDPILDYPPKEDLLIRKKHQIENSKTIFLIFGAIDERKNITNLLKAFQQLPNKIAEKSSLLIIGKVEKVFNSHFEELIASTNKIQPNLNLIIENRFVDDGEMESYFSQSDVILRMNLNYFNSSGVLGNAAKYNKPSLVSDYGLVAELTKTYHLGKLANPENIDEIKSVITDFIENPQLLKIDGSEFYNVHHKDNIFKELIR